MSRVSWPRLLFAACLLYALWAMGVGFDHTLLDVHGFRQTQTAIAVEYMLKGSSWLRYETPVLGAPWSIPFEFPLYQWIVAGIVALLGTPIAQTGRLVAAGFFLLTLFPILSLQKTLGLRDDRRFIFPSLLLVSPLYLFWSRTFLIESTALFLSVSFLAFAAKWIRSDEGKTGAVIPAVVAGAAAAAVKLTTFVGVLPGLALLWVWVNRTRAPSGGTPRRIVVAGTLLAGLPVLTGTAWNWFSDGVKRENVLAAGYLTSDTMWAWNFGTLTQKLDGLAWTVFLHRTALQAMGTWVLVPAGLTLLLFTPLAYRRAFLALLVAFIAAPLVFTNLHFVHEYYPYANSLFLIAAVACCVAGCLESSRPLVRIAAVGLLALSLFMGINQYRRSFLLLQTRNRQPDHQLLERVRRVVDSTQVMLIYGWDWNPELPYYVGRRALMDREKRDIEGPVMVRARQALDERGFRLTALLACNDARQADTLIHRATAVLGFAVTPLYSGQRCDLYARPG